MKLLRMFLWILALLPLTACGLSGGPIEGQVQEANTNKPIPGAIVIARWQGFKSIFPADGQTLCYHVESAVTDAQGAYRIPAWQGDLQHANLQDKAIYIDAYKSGYIRSPEYFKQQSYRQGIELMEVFKGTREERLKYLERISEATRCPSAGESGKNVLTFRKAIYAEANGIASSKGDMNVVEGLLFQMEIVEFGYAAAERNQVQRYRGGGK